MTYALYFIHILVSIFLILVVLLQQGKGADLSVFGGGGTQVAFGARGAATVLHKLTVTCFILFLLTTVSLGIMSARTAPSVMNELAAEEEPATDDLAGPAGGTLDGEESPPGDDSSADEASGDGATTDPTATEDSGDPTANTASSPSDDVASSSTPQSDG